VGWGFGARCGCVCGDLLGVDEPRDQRSRVSVESQEGAGMNKGRRVLGSVVVGWGVYGWRFMGGRAEVRESGDQSRSQGAAFNRPQALDLAQGEG